MIEQYAIFKESIFSLIYSLSKSDIIGISGVIVTLGVGVLALKLAAYIGDEQIKLSNKQSIISKRQNKINILLYYMSDTDKTIDKTHKMFVSAAKINSELTEKIAENLGGFIDVKKELGEILDDIAKEEFDE